MSFICNDCKQAQPNGIYPVKKVVKRREKRDGSFEIVKELDLCPRCKHHSHGMITTPYKPAAPIHQATTSDLKRCLNRR